MALKCYVSLPRLYRKDSQNFGIMEELSVNSLDNCQENIEANDNKTKSVINDDSLIDDSIRSFDSQFKTMWKFNPKRSEKDSNAECVEGNSYSTLFGVRNRLHRKRRLLSSISLSQCRNYLFDHRIEPLNLHKEGASFRSLERFRSGVTSYSQSNVSNSSNANDAIRFGTKRRRKLMSTRLALLELDEEEVYLSSQMSPSHIVSTPSFTDVYVSKSKKKSSTVNVARHCYSSPSLWVSDLRPLLVASESRCGHLSKKMSKSTKSRVIRR